MSLYQEKAAFALLAVETVSGTEQALTGANAIRASTLNEGVSAEQRDVSRNVGTLKSRRRVLAGLNLNPTMTVELTGSGSAGTAPDWGTAMLGCANAAFANPTDISGLASAAGTTTTIKLAASASATDDAYNGMPILLTGGGGYQAPPKEAKFNIYQIVDYEGSTKTATVYPALPVASSATTAYTIPACVGYRPTYNNLKSLTGHFYLRSDDGADAYLLPGVKMIGNCSVTLPVRGPGTIEFSFQSGFQNRRRVADGSVPTPAFQDSLSIAWRDAVTYVNNALICMNQFTMDWGNQLQQLECPNAYWGIEGAYISSQDMTGSLNPRLANPDTFDVFKSLVEGTQYRFMTYFGGGAGDQIMIGLSKMAFKNLSLARNNGNLATELEYDNENDDNEAWLVTF